MVKANSNRTESKCDFMKILIKVKWLLEFETKIEQEQIRIKLKWFF